MQRRDFIKGISVSFAWPLAAQAQQTEQARRIGIVMPYAKGDAENEARVAAFKQELAKLGWAEGRNVRLQSAFGPSACNAS